MTKQKGNFMKLAALFLFGILFSFNCFAQEKSESNCCSDKLSKTTLSKICDVPDEVSLISDDDNKLTTSVEVDDKSKKVEKNLKSDDKKVKTDKTKSSSSDEGCCSTDKKKIEKTKSPKS